MTQNDRPASGLRRRSQVQSLHKPPFELTGFGRSADFADHDRILADLASTAIESERLPESGLLVAVSSDALAEPSLRLGEDGEDLLDDARAGIAAGRFDIALALLEEYLERHESHQEARFLRAYCLTYIAEPRPAEALGILRPLRDETTPEEVGKRVGELRRELRRRLAPGEYKAYADKAEQDPRGALSRAAEFLELVPEDGKLWSLVVLGHARLGELDQALDAAETGIGEADSDQERLEELAHRLLLIRLRPLAEPAARAFKARDPHLAVALLGRVEARWRSTAPIRDFQRYLALVIEHANPSPPPAPLLPDDRAEDLYSLIAETDVSRALALMDRGGLERAERFLAGLMRIVPGFRWLNFVYAICLYRQGRRANEAEACARVALRDPTIGQARDLLNAIHGWQEAIVINPVVDEFVKIADLLHDRPAPEHLPVLRKRLVLLEARIPALRKATRTPDGEQVVAEVASAISTWRSELDKAEVINAFFQEYEHVMATAAGGLKNVRDAERIATSLDALGARIRATRAQMGTARGGSSGGTHPLDELANRVQARRAETETVKTTIAVAEIVQRFNELMNPILSGPPNAQVFQLVGVHAKKLGQEAQRLRQAAGQTLDQRDRQLLDQLLGTIGRLWP